MKLLHQIYRYAMTAAVWAYVYGANGREIAPDGVKYHLWQIDRGNPPDPTTDVYQRYAYYRQYWTPWQTTPTGSEARLTPLCGRLRSTSQSPRWAPFSPYGTTGIPTSSAAHNGHNVFCLGCLRAAEHRRLPIGTTRQLADNDPWVIKRNQNAASFQSTWYNEPDPVSGL